tara:strand:+ start:379032 stop:380081 length:1050 start_codon:yes stop_codon:yes gene_type:complete
MIMKQINFRLYRQQTGQAMTEFVVSVSFVFLSLFVIVPMFGKLMDLQYQTQQASRYVAWERTVWFDQGDTPDESVISNAYWESVATRSDDTVMDTMTSRFFEGTGPGGLKPITEDDTSVGDDETNPIWTYVQSKKTMYGGTTIGSGKDLETGRNQSLNGQLTPAIGYKVVDVINDGVKVIADPVNAFLGAIGGSNDDFMTFAYETDNYYSPVITTHLIKENSHGGGNGVWDRDTNGKWGSGIEDALFSSGWDGTLTARSAILADGWNTQSLEHFQNRADDFVPSTLFDNALFDAAITVASILDGGPGNSAVEKLDFGAVGIEPMPSEDGKPLDVSETGGIDGGFYYYDD